MHSDQRYAVYVAGIPTKTTKKEIFSYFSQFGPITQVETFDNAEASGFSAAGFRRIKGYCVVTTSNKQAYASILGFSTHMMFGRSILCAKYQEGSKLMRLNRLNNQRRVVIKILNGDLKQEDLKSFLDLNVGRVEVLHELKPDYFMFTTGGQSGLDTSKTNTLCGNNNVVPSKAFSVMFSDKNHAQAMISKGNLLGPRNIALVIERFKPQSKKIGDTTEVSTAPNSSSPQEIHSTYKSESKPHIKASHAMSSLSTAFDSSSNSTPPHCSTNDETTLKNSKTCNVLREKYQPPQTTVMSNMISNNHLTTNLRFNQQQRRY